MKKYFMITRSATEPLGYFWWCPNPQFSSFGDRTPGLLAEKAKNHCLAPKLIDKFQEAS